MTKETTITAYKGFDKNLKCRDFQYEVGKTYTHKGKVKIGESGFHAWENPLNVLGFYSPTDRFAIVKCAGEISKARSGTRFSCGKLTVETEIGVHKLTAEAVEWLLPRLAWENKREANTERAVACITGDHSAASSTKDQSVSSTTGDYSVSISTGTVSVSSSTGDYSVASSTGSQAVACNTGARSVACSTGNLSLAYSKGFESVSSSTGNHSVSISAGAYSAARSIGNYSVSLDTGRHATAEVSGVHSVACAFGYSSKVKAAEGSAIVCVYRGKCGELIHIRAAKVGEHGIKPDTWYTLNEHGDFVECE